jgi:uncharacterized protein
MNNRLADIYKSIPKSTCPPNCGACCGILYPSMAEIRNVKEWLASKNKPYKDFVMVSDCPYCSLDKSCEIYPVRPFLCRILGTSVDLPCPLKANKPERILNHSVSSALYTEIYLKGKEKPRTEKHRKAFKPIIEQFLVGV